MILSIIGFIALIVILQLIIGHFFHEIGFDMKWSIIMMLLPLGIGVFLAQNLYFERRYPDWNLPYSTKIRLKYIYILTFLEYVGVYICFFLLN